MKSADVGNTQLTSAFNLDASMDVWVKDKFNVKRKFESNYMLALKVNSPINPHLKRSVEYQRVVHIIETLSSIEEM